MTTKVLEKEVHKLKQEVVLLRSLVIGVFRERKEDPEGECRPEFVKKALKAMETPAAFRYAGKGSLLKQLQSLK